MNIGLLRIPIIIIATNFAVFALIPGDPTGLVGDVIFNIVRFSMFAYAGWLVVRRGNGKIRSAAFVGFLLFAFDHVFLKGGKFLLDTYLYNEPFTKNVDAFIGVLISFGMLFALPMAVAVIGGVVARYMKVRRPEQPI